MSKPNRVTICSARLWAYGCLGVALAYDVRAIPRTVSVGELIEGKALVLQRLNTSLMFARVSSQRRESPDLNLDLEQPK